MVEAEPHHIHMREQMKGVGGGIYMEGGIRMTG